MMRVWRRPEGMDPDEFMAIKPEQCVAELGPPEWEGPNIMTNAFFADIFSLLMGVFGTVDSMTVNALVVGTGNLTGAGGAKRTDTSLITQWKSYPVIATSVVATDSPLPSVTFSFFMPAGDGAVVLTEAGLQRTKRAQTLSLRLISHLAFAYTKPGNQDVRVDYQITRTST